MAGRRPKPTTVKVLEGNPGKRPLNEREPRPRAADIRVPYGRLPRDGQRLWRELAGQLDELGVLKATDLPALEMLCLHYAVARAALGEMIADGRTTGDNGEVVSEGIAVTAMGMGGVKKHPAASVFRENAMAFKGWAVEFGLTPAARVKIKTDAGEHEKTLAELLFEGISEGGGDG